MSARACSEDFIAASVRTDARRPLARRVERRRSSAAARARARSAVCRRASGCLLAGRGDAPQAARTAGGLEDMRRGVELLRRSERPGLRRAHRRLRWLEAEARAGDVDRALAILDEALATSDRNRASLLRRVTASRARRNPAEARPRQSRPGGGSLPDRDRGREAASHAQSSICGRRSALAKLYQSTGRPADAHAVLAPALEGFSPTPEMPEIAEAQALLAALARDRRGQGRRGAAAATDAACTSPMATRSSPRAATARRKRRKPSPEPAKSASGDKDAPERLAADYGLWVGSYVRGDLPSMRAHAAAFLSDVEARPDSPEAGVAHRAAGITCWFAGEYREARDHFERALALFQPGRDDDLAFRFGHDPGVAAMAYLAIASWPLGEVDRAISLIDRMQTRIAGLITRWHARAWKNARGHVRIDAWRPTRAPRRTPSSLPGSRVSMTCPCFARSAFSPGLGDRCERRARQRARGHAPRRRAAARTERPEFRRALEDCAGRGRSPGGRSDRAVAILDEALATCDRTGYRAFEAELHRARGEILLKRDPANPAPAEEAFLAAIAVAKQQGTRSFDLRAALVARQALPIDRPPRRRPRRPRARARRLFADARNAGDRRGAGAARGARGEVTRSRPKPRGGSD